MRLFACVVLAALMVGGCGGDDGGSASWTRPAANLPISTTAPPIATAAEAVLGRAALVNYTGWLYSTTATDNKGVRFDSSLDPGRQPLVINSLGTGLIQGFSRGVQGMRVGGLRRVVIPPDLGYG